MISRASGSTGAVWKHRLERRTGNKRRQTKHFGPGPSAPGAPEGGVAELHRARSEAVNRARRKRRRFVGVCYLFGALDFVGVTTTVHPFEMHGVEILMVFASSIFIPVTSPRKADALHCFDKGPWQAFWPQFLILRAP